MVVLVTPPDLARTYNSQSYEDPWQAVEDYQRVLEYTGRHPNKGSSAVSAALDLPRGRVHPWMDGSRPAPVRAIQIAEQNEWVPLDTEEDIFTTFNRLVAWIFSRGSITEAEYTPFFSCEKTTEKDRLADLFDTIGVSYTICREDTTAKATEARLTEHRTIIGRLLALLGAPVGSRLETRVLPSYLTPSSQSNETETVPKTESADSPNETTPQPNDSPSVTRTEPQTHARIFADTYLANTARFWDWRNGYIVRHEDRSIEYLRALANVFEFASGDSEVEVNPDSLFLPAPLAERLCPELAERPADDLSDTA